eukprot:COSAG06_NODE_12615_length_1354_cov_1.443825_2_plen_45_part_01
MRRSACYGQLPSDAGCAGARLRSQVARQQSAEAAAPAAASTMYWR